MANLGVPVKLLHESLGHVITVELKTGEVCPYPLHIHHTDPDRCTEGSSWRVRPYRSPFLAKLMRSTLTAEDSLNIALREITVTARDGRVSQLEQVYIRGSMVGFSPLQPIDETY